MTDPVQEELVLGRSRLGMRRTSGRGRPVVMLHGLMDSAAGWDPFARSISRPTVAFDLPGFGESTPAGYDLEEWRKLFQWALKKLDIGNCFLLGHSLGGAVASVVAGGRPELTSGLLLIAPAGFGPVPLAQFLGRPEVEFLLGRTAPGAMQFRPVVREVYRRLFTHAQDLSDPLLERLVAGRITMVPGIRQGMNILRRHSRKPFEEIPYRGPVAALIGDRDRLVPAGRTMKGVRRVFPQADETILDEIGHHPQAECPEDTLDWIAHWTDSRVSQPLVPETDRAAETSLVA
ncbi:MAG: alpha/beta hydrolase [Solirubrobacterales bacterium]|nr:alpha/beta hydrolase [Solirubrobacterales bacterium]